MDGDDTPENWLADIVEEYYPEDSYARRAAKREKFKYYNQHYGFAPDKPIHRFLRANVGRRWDDVYSELCATHKGIDRLKLEHYLHVEEGYYTANGRVWNTKRERIDTSIGGHYDFYVVDGILRVPDVVVSHRSRDAGLTLEERRRKNGVIHKEGNIYAQMNGIWYVLEMREIPRHPALWKVDKFLNGRVSYGKIEKLEKSRLEFWYGTDKLYCNGWQQLGKRQLRLLGLSNE